MCSDGRYFTGRFFCYHLGQWLQWYYGLLSYTYLFYMLIIITAILGNSTMQAENLSFIQSCIKTIPDYPKPGILFRDITSLVEHGEAFKATIDLLVERFRGCPLDKVVGTEARGFIFGAPVAAALGLGFVPVRKPGKLPRCVFEESYELEYGQDALQIHKDAIVPGDRILIIDDLLATGGTVEAAVKLIQRCGGIVNQAAFVISLPDLGGEARLRGAGVEPLSLIQFPGH